MLTFVAQSFRYSVLSLSAVAAAWFVAPASAATVNFGGNWQASWDASLDGLVNLTNISITGNTISLVKNANFTQGPSGSGLFPTIPITFTQTGASTVDHIVILDEVINNNTGVSWNGFRMDILSGIGVASFDVAATAASGGPLPIGFAIAPFTTASFSSANQRLDIGGGTVANGGVWLPGSGANGGALSMSVLSTSVGPFSSFSLKETPVPTPGALALLTLAAFTVGHRSRRRR